MTRKAVDIRIVQDLLVFYYNYRLVPVHFGLPSRDACIRPIVEAVQAKLGDLNRLDGIQNVIESYD